MQRRHFIKQAGVLAGAALASRSTFASPTAINVPKGKAEHVVFVWLGGGMAQIDTFDPKNRGNSKATPKLAGSEYDTIDTIVPGVKFCEHLHRTAKLADRLTAVRTVNHHLVDEHAFGTNFVHTGRLITGSTTYPSIGSIVSHVRGAVNPDVPAYMLIGYPNVSRGPGFLGAKAGYVYLVDTESGPAGFTRPEGVTSLRVDRRRQLLEPLTARVPNDSVVAQYRDAQSEALRLAGPDFMRHFRLKDESDELRQAYGGEFGQRCLLARRLVQAGVRFIEVSHNLNFINGTGWDTHNEGQQNQHLLIEELDIALSALITDLEQKKMLDKTLIAIGTEFGRPAAYDARGGRGHQGSCFSLLLAGGGLNHQGAYGVTDELSKNIVENPVSVPDFHATIHAALGINPALELFDNARPVPITDGGKPIAALFG
ncbi:DUF1501 domain-containing protein [Thalassoglobus polymorphus]|uniref:DUF1501 domain-containing protein n=1 Tax=Thalassoglobus polymorphus TaxID=2527994 RepID=A0A517QJW3_9PLAN|nr:DUF1501 domain-containing protein [Thalassoglobus polymorphus]QDT31931.1 hypothetical protein Mal48_11690 [Thalassoglobus polymorphus]